MRISGQSLTSKTCAKINLFLYVTGKRPDGYHSICTLFVPINIYDEIRITKTLYRSFICNDPTIPADEENIIIKADNILKQEYGLKDNFKIELTKNIPYGAGLGGGSSDGACYVKLVNEFSNMGLSYEDMVNVMSKIGSDTVFFINSKPAIGVGRGEILLPAPKLPQMFFIIINPKINISTKKVYQNKTLVLTDINLIPNLEEEIIFANLKNIMKNDLETPVFEEWQEVAALVEDLKRHSDGNALMSGSGSSVFAVYENKTVRDEEYEMLKNKYPNYLVYKAEVK